MLLIRLFMMACSSINERTGRFIRINVRLSAAQRPAIFAGDWVRVAQHIGTRRGIPRVAYPKGAKGAVLALLLCSILAYGSGMTP